MAALDPHLDRLISPTPVAIWRQAPIGGQENEPILSSGKIETTLNKLAPPGQPDSSLYTANSFINEFLDGDV